jgi:hypothetical protein
MKVLNLLYIKIVAITFILPSFGGVGGGLYAQDSRLFENIWYLHDLVIDGSSNIPPINSEIPYVPAEFIENGTLNTEICDYGGSGLLDYIGTTQFFVLEMNFLQGGCHTNHPTNEDYSGLYQNFWGPLYENFVLYEIIEEGQNRTLIITGSNGDQAIYENEAPLSTSTFHQESFTLYPNPVAETLFINTTFNQDLQASIYDLSGKLLQSNTIDATQTQIDVGQFKSGVYFVVFENKSGEKIRRKFVKQ